MKRLPLLCLLLPVMVGCTSVKVNRLTEQRFPKVPAKSVQRINEEEARQHKGEKIATIDMRTGSPFAADLNALAKKRTGQLGGQGYVITASSAQTVVSGGFGSLFGDSTEATLSIEAVHWAEPTAAAPASAAPAAAPQPKARRWWWPF